MIPPPQRVTAPLDEVIIQKVYKGLKSSQWGNVGNRDINVDKGDLESEWKTNFFETEQSKGQAKPS